METVSYDKNALHTCVAKVTSRPKFMRIGWIFGQFDMEWWSGRSLAPGCNAMTQHFILIISCELIDLLPQWQFRINCSSNFFCGDEILTISIRRHRMQIRSPSEIRLKLISCISRLAIHHIFAESSGCLHLRHHLLTWFNLNPSMN